MRSERWLVLLLIVLSPGIMLGPVWTLAGLGAGEDDVLYFLPGKLFFQQCVLDGHPPWLNPWNGLDRGFLADPQAAVFYPFTWLFALMPALSAYALNLWAHYSLGTWGAYRLIRSCGMDRRAAIFGGVVFGFCGFLLAHRAHFSMQAAAAWTPWVFWRIARYAQRKSGMAETNASEEGGRPPNPPILSISLVWASLAAAAQSYAGHTQMAALTSLGTLVWLIASNAARRRNAPGQTGPGEATTTSGHRSVAVRWGIVWLVTAGLFAPQWIPTLAYTRECTRVDRTFVDFTENSYHPASLVGLIAPLLYGQRVPNLFSQEYWGPSHQVEQTAYTGVLPLLLAAMALRGPWRFQPQRFPWLVLAGFTLLTALGRFGPVCPILYWIPGSQLFRVPARAMLLFDLAIAVLAARAVADLAAPLTPLHARLRATLITFTRRPLTVSATIIGGIIVLVLLALPWLEASTRQAALRALSPINPALWFPLGMLLGGMFVLRFAAVKWERPALLWLIVAWTALDLGVLGWSIDVPHSASSPTELFTPDPQNEWLDLLKSTKGRIWVVTPRIGEKPGEYLQPLRKLAANTNLFVPIASLTDYGPLQPREFATRFGFAPWGESAYAVDLLEDNLWMRRFAVEWVLLCDTALPAPENFTLMCTTYDGWRLYASDEQPEFAGFEDFAHPGVVRYEAPAPHRFTLTIDTTPRGVSITTRPDNAVQYRESGDDVRVVIARLALPGWRAALNGRPVGIEAYDDLLLAVRVPLGLSRIEFEYHPPGLIAGLAIGFVSIVLLAVTGAFHATRRG